ncbi:MAG: polysaccharide biosynthesis C-terminal domain-containing protein, partial [Acidimicrobiales bacterium]
GANFSQALTLIATNALGPAGVRIGNIYGREGPERAFKEYADMQRIWVVAVTGWSAVGMAAAYFGTTAWLGPGFQLASWVAVAAICASMPWLLMGMVNIYLTLMRRAGLEMRCGLVAMGLNIALAIPASLFGAVAVVAATGLAQLLSAAYLFRLARRQLRSDIPSVIREIPVLRALAAAAVTVALELLLRPHVHVGTLGLLECVPPAIIGLLVFTVLVVGPTRLVRLVKRRGSAEPPTEVSGQLGATPTVG